ncbi:hypothetical protein BRARA_K01842 [Brassica rapa]|uniref:KIB1-4 beta-propeller domain-containing protein n=1 Tax=Brassica campestris TaxID=3711 RepID=A0A397KZE0_BRACM|nr:hypothetical protein BRARA_K01842 [Brassica rapa]
MLPEKGTFQRKLGDFSGCRFLANSGNWLLLLDSGSSLYISIDSADCIVKSVGDRKFVRQDSDSIFSDLSADVVRGLLWVSESGKEYVVDITDGTPFPMLSADMSYDSSIAVTTSGQVLLVESDPCNRTCFRLYKKNPDIENPDLFGHTVTEVDSLDGEALLLDLGYTVPANKALDIKPDSIYFTRHYRPCQCASPDLDICVFNLATKTLHRFPDLDKMNLMDARWFLPSGNYAF